MNSTCEGPSPLCWAPGIETGTFHVEHNSKRVLSVHKQVVRCNESILICVEEHACVNDKLALTAPHLALALATGTVHQQASLSRWQPQHVHEQHEIMRVYFFVLPDYRTLTPDENGKKYSCSGITQRIPVSGEKTTRTPFFDALYSCFGANQCAVHPRGVKTVFIFPLCLVRSQL